MAPRHHDDPAALLRELEHHNDFFDSVVDMIPAKLYVAGNSGDDGALNSKYFKGQHKQSKELKRARTKAAKRAKFDPNQSESTTEAKEKKEQQLEEEANKELSELEPSETLAKKHLDKSRYTVNVVPQKETTDNKSRIEALRAKLHAKIAEKRALRPNSDSSAVSKRAARRAEKQRRQKEAQGKKKNRVNSHSSPSVQHAITGSNMGTPDIIPSPMDDLKHLDFGTLAGLNNISSKANNKSLLNLNKTKNLEKMLHDAELKKQKLQELKESAAQQDKEQAKGIMWKDTLKEASGERVKDDPAHIKKLLKRKVAKKKKSQVAWKSRLTQVQQQAQDRQSKRQANLQQRRQTGVNKKQKDEPKKNRAGFEGRKQGFLNKGRGTNKEQ